MFPSHIAILAAAEGSVVMAIVLTISVISWIVNLIQGSNPKGAKPANRPRAANQEKSELEKFLQEVVGAKPAPEPEKKRPVARKPPRPNGGEKKGGKSKPQSQQPSRPPATQRPAPSERPGARLAQTHLAPMAGGTGVHSNFDTRDVNSLVKQDVDGAVLRDVVDKVQRDIGADGTKLTIERGPVHPLIQALRNPQGVRQAIIMSEILNRPRSLR